MADKSLHIESFKSEASRNSNKFDVIRSTHSEHDVQSKDKIMETEEGSNETKGISPQDKARVKKELGSLKYQVVAQLRMLALSKL